MLVPTTSMLSVHTARANPVEKHGDEGADQGKGDGHEGASKGQAQEQGQGQGQEQGQGQAQEQGQGQAQEQGQGQAQEQGQGQAQEQGQGQDSETELQETQTGKAKYTQTDVDSDDKPQYVPARSDEAQPLAVPAKPGYSGTRIENSLTLSTNQLAEQIHHEFVRYLTSKILSRFVDLLSKQTDGRLLKHDAIPPQLILPSVTVTKATSTSGAEVGFIVGAYDNVDGFIAPKCSRASGSVFPIGIRMCPVTQLIGQEILPLALLS